MAKKIAGYIKLQVKAGQANPAPPVGPALGQKGLNIMEFCKAFNAESQKFAPGTPVPVTITAYQDRSFSFIMKTPPASWYLMQAAKKKKGASLVNKATPVAKVTKAQIKEIAEAKMVDLNATNIEAAMKIIEGSARSMGFEVVA